MLFTDAWGVDVAVSTPLAIVAATEGTIDVGHLVRLMALRQGRINLEKLTLPDDHPLVGRAVRDLALPESTALILVVRGGRVMLPRPEDVLRARDELLFAANSAAEEQIRAVVHAAPRRTIQLTVGAEWRVQPFPVCRSSIRAISAGRSNAEKCPVSGNVTRSPSVSRRAT